MLLASLLKTKTSLTLQMVLSKRYGLRHLEICGCISNCFSVNICNMLPSLLKIKECMYVKPHLLSCYTHNSVVLFMYCKIVGTIGIWGRHGPWAHQTRAGIHLHTMCTFIQWWDMLCGCQVTTNWLTAIFSIANYVCLAFEKSIES